MKAMFRERRSSCKVLGALCGYISLVEIFNKAKKQRILLNSWYNFSDEYLVVVGYIGSEVNTNVSYKVLAVIYMYMYILYMIVQLYNLLYK